MSYGFEARNAANEIVIDNSFPVYELSAPSTITSNVPNSTTSSGNWVFPVPPLGVLRFWKLNVGDGISLAPDKFIGNKQTYTIRDVVPASSLPDPSGYGMAIYDSNGQKVYATNGQLLTIGDKYSVQLQSDGSRPPVNVSDSWVAIETFVMNMVPVNPFFGGILSSGTKRTSATQMAYYGAGFASAPAGYTFFNPVKFITAK